MLEPRAPRGRSLWRPRRDQFGRLWVSDLDVDQREHALKAYDWSRNLAELREVAEHPARPHAREVVPQGAGLASTE